ncbi:MAG TPA: threonine-phosphate decarboxylase CobD [Xanthobacteraceae bacterium]|nr:threonine-phosphate decarboxylase CobD [Xanthobacteraceae bacterium]
MEPIYHGGDIGAARAQFPAAPQPWIDLSTGINPLPYPVGRLDPMAWARLPAADALERLEAAAAEAYGAAASGLVAAVPGTQSLIQLLPRLLPARRVAVLGFGYQEHPESWRRAGAELRIATDAAELVDSRPDVAVIVNPNNPDGRRIAVAELEAIAAQVGTLVVDEAFMDLCPPEASLVPRLPPAGCVVLRSFGKTYGLAGLRLGFAVAAPDVAHRLKAMLGPWAVSGPAIAIGTAALRDRDWLERTRRRTERAAARLDRLLERAGLRVVGGTALFRLAAHDDAPEIFAALGRAGILVRRFPARPHWLRFGLPAGAPAWDRLERALPRTGA